MPTYEYQCDKCKKGFELVQSMKDDALTVCPKTHCRQKTWGKGKVRRQVGTGAGLIFKGSGFYITDYRSEGYKAAERKDKPESKSESKVADKAANAVEKSHGVEIPKPKPAEKKTGKKD
jgi:putative FmdB family regulatory protein